MKKLYLLIAFLFFIPNFTYAAVNTPWVATSTTQGNISPATVNGVIQTPLAKNYIASSTTATSTFAGHAIFGQTYTTSLGDVGGFGLGLANSAIFKNLNYSCAAMSSNIGYSCSSGTLNVSIFDPVELNGLIITNGTNFFTAGNTGNAFLSTGIGIVNGFLGISSSSPTWGLSLSGRAYIDDYAQASYFKGTSTIPSVFPNSSTTIATVSSKLYIPTGQLLVGSTTGSTNTFRSVLGRPSGGGDPGSLYVAVADDSVNAVQIFQDVNNLSMFHIDSSNQILDMFGTNGGRVGVGSTSPWAILAVNPVAGKAANQFVVGSSTATNFIVKNNGFVGVGTTTPGLTFSVQGNALFSGNLNSANLTTGTANIVSLNVSAESFIGSDLNIANGGITGTGGSFINVDSTIQGTTITGTMFTATANTATSTFSGYVNVNNLVKLMNYTVAALPTCNANSRGSIAYVTDALAPTFLVAVTGGGAVVSPVFCNGANWVSN